MDIPIPNTIRVCTFQNGKVFTPQQPYTIFPGDVFEFGHLSTPFSPFASAVVASVAQNVTPFYDVTFEGGLPAGVLVSDIVVQATMATALLRNFTVCCNRARGILIKNRGTLIDNCQVHPFVPTLIALTSPYYRSFSITPGSVYRSQRIAAIGGKDLQLATSLWGILFLTAATLVRDRHQRRWWFSWKVHSPIKQYHSRQAPIATSSCKATGSPICQLVEVFISDQHSTSLLKSTLNHLYPFHDEVLTHCCYSNYIATTADKPLIYCNSKQVAVDNNLLSPSFNYSRYDTRSGCALALSEVVEGVNGGKIHSL